MTIVVTIPAYNEEKSIGSLIAEIKKAMNSSKYSNKYRILVVDDGSNDRTAEAAEKSGAIVHKHPKNYGLAETFKTEIEQSLKLNADAIVHIDADSQYLPKEIPKLLEELDNGYDLVLGSRFMGTIEHMPLLKKLGNMAFSRVISNIARLRISDAQTGFRAFTSEVAGKISITSSHTYTQEQIIRAAKNKFRIKEVPVYFAKRNGKSRLVKNPFEYAIKAWINLIRIYRDYEPLKFFGVFGSAIFFIGLLLGAYLGYIQFFKGGVFRHLGLMMVDILILSVGLQIIVFGFIADMLKK